MNQETQKAIIEQKEIKKMLNDCLCTRIPDLHALPKGDVPGEKADVTEAQVKNAAILFQELVNLLPPYLTGNPCQRAVISVCGGSGAGKSGMAALLSWYFTQAGVGCYILSGDNYPHRIPRYNDAERLRIYRESGIRRMIEDGVYSAEHFSMLQHWQKMEEDAEPKHLKEAPWFASYLDGGRTGLKRYLGTEKEIAFEEVNAIVSSFKGGAEEIWLRRMGRDETELWYDRVDFGKTHILLMEWTHGNSDFIQGVDIPILLNSTPQETLAYRKARNRDKGTDSPFTTMVLEIEQEMLYQQAKKAKLILSKTGELLTYEAYCRRME